MHNWNFSPEQMISLTLAADARLGSTDYTNDQIWDFKLGSSEPASISLETTFGLRARLCRIFPRFIFNNKIVNDPAQFSHPIIIHRYYPNYLEISFKPFNFINVILEYWVPGSQVIAGRIKIKNPTHEKYNMQMELVELLLPSVDGSRMTVNEIGMTTLLSGKTSNISPLLFLTGGAQAGKSPYPSLQLSFVIPPHGNYEAYWAHASADNVEKSYELGKEVINKNWDAEFARLTRVNELSIQIQTGNQDWNTAFNLSQNLAYQLFLQPTNNCRAPSFVSARKPDQGYSLLGDGSDYNHQWNGQTPFDSHYLTNLLLPTTPEFVKGLLDNFLDIQTSQGEIDLKPGLGAQRSHLIATPLLADIALQLSDYDEYFDYLKSIFPKLVSFFLSWFSSTHDRDGDHFPESDHPIQLGLEDLPFFSQDSIGSMGIDISTIETPCLCSYLYRECIALISIGEKINNNDSTKQLESYAEKLKTLVEQTWNEQYACYLPRDRDSHVCSSGENLGTRTGEGIIEVQRDFYLPVRPVIKLESQDKITHPTKIFIHGSGANGTHRVENIPAYRIHWQDKYGFITSSYTYNSIEQIEITGIRPDDKVSINSANLAFMDQSTLLPLWAGIPSKERAKILINLTIMNKKKFLDPNGLRLWIDYPKVGKISEDYHGFNLPWISLILEGLIQYDERSKAAEVFIRFMKPIIRSIQKDLTFNHSFHFENGTPFGTQNSLTSLVPIGLFLKILGVKIITPYIVEIFGHNPFPWPVTVNYHGLSITKQERKTLIIFPDGQNLTVDNDQYQRINCKRINQVDDNKDN